MANLKTVSKKSKAQSMGMHTLRYEIDYDTKDLLDFSQRIESIPGVEILSMGKSLEVIKDLGNAKMVCDRYLSLIHISEPTRRS